MLILSGARPRKAVIQLVTTMPDSSRRSAAAPGYHAP